MSRDSKIQLQVLKLYRDFLRLSRDKPGVRDHVRSEFKRHAGIPKQDALTIEHLIRRAERQLSVLSKPSVQGVGVFEKDAQETTK